MVTPESISEGAEKQPKGSVMIFEADTIEEVKSLVENDVYYKEKVVGFVLFCTTCQQAKYH